MLQTDGDTCWYLSKLTDELLARLAAVSLVWKQQAEALAYELFRAIESELSRRMQDPESPIEADTFKLDLGKWSNRDIAEGLRLTGVLTSTTEHVEVGDLLDAIHAVLVLESATRLEATIDPRNERGYLDRNQTNAN